MKRRELLKTAFAGLLAAPFVHAEEPKSNAAPHAGPKKPVRLGGPLFFSDEDPQAWAKKAREMRYRAVYAPKVALDDRTRIDAILQAVRENDLVIAEVGRWVNLLDADPVKRAKNLKQVTEGLALADELDAKCCVDIAGSFNPKVWSGPDPRNVTEEFFDATVQNVRTIIDAVKPKRSKFALEMMGWALPNSPESYLRLIAAVDRPQFGVHIDVCNLINSPDKFWNTTKLINDVFDQLGPYVLSAHAKDLRWIPEMSIRFQECVIGQGTIDFATYLHRLAILPQDVPFMIEHMANAEEYEASKLHLFDIGRDAGIAFEVSVHGP